MKDLTGCVKISSARITLAKQKYGYDGKEIMPGVSVTYKDKKLVENKDYYILYYDNINAGTATVEIAGIGDYIGRAFKTFEIAKASRLLPPVQLIRRFWPVIPL